MHRVIPAFSLVPAVSATGRRQKINGGGEEEDKDWWNGRFVAGDMDRDEDYHTRVEYHSSARHDGDTEAMGSPMGPHDLRRGMALPVSASAEAMVCGGTRPVGAPLRPGRDRVPAGDVEYDSWSDDYDDRAVGRPPSRVVDSGADTRPPQPAGRETAVAVSVIP